MFLAKQCCLYLNLSWLREWQAGKLSNKTDFLEIIGLFLISRYLVCFVMVRCLESTLSERWRGGDSARIPSPLGSFLTGKGVQTV